MQTRPLAFFLFPFIVIFFASFLCFFLIFLSVLFFLLTLSSHSR